MKPMRDIGIDDTWTAVMVAPSETQIQAACLAALKLAFPRGWFHRNNTAGRKGRLGTVGLGKGGPDIVGCVDGWMVAVEVKRPKEKQRPGQVEWQKQHEDAKGIYVVVRSPQEAVDSVRSKLDERRAA